MSLRNKNMSKRKKIKIYKTLIRPVITYTMETNSNIQEGRGRTKNNRAKDNENSIKTKHDTRRRKETKEKQRN